MEKRETIKSKKEILWKQKRAEVEKITDGISKEVDQNIKETVTAFLVHEFTTSGSCEGHLDEEHGLPYPWIEINTPAPEGWRESEKKKKEWTIENLKQRQRAMNYLAEFYQDRDTPFDARLTFDRIGAFGAFRIQSFGANMVDLLSPEEQKRKLELYKKEMNDFTKFLKNKYFFK